MAEWEQELKRYFSQLGRKGGKRSLETMTETERKERAKKAAAARWGKKPKKKAAAKKRAAKAAQKGAK
jgi:hypothetical protein